MINNAYLLTFCESSSPTTRQLAWRILLAVLSLCQTWLALCPATVQHFLVYSSYCSCLPTTDNQSIDDILQSHTTETQGPVSRNSLSCSVLNYTYTTWLRWQSFNGFDSHHPSVVFSSLWDKTSLQSNWDELAKSSGYYALMQKNVNSCALLTEHQLHTICSEEAITDS